MCELRNKFMLVRNKNILIRLVHFCKIPDNNIYLDSLLDFSCSCSWSHLTVFSKFHNYSNLYLIILISIETNASNFQNNRFPRIWDEVDCSKNTQSLINHSPQAKSNFFDLKEDKITDFYDLIHFISLKNRITLEDHDF